MAKWSKKKTKQNKNVDKKDATVRLASSLANFLIDIIAEISDSTKADEHSWVKIMKAGRKGGGGGKEHTSTKVPTHRWRCWLRLRIPWLVSSGVGTSYTCDSKAERGSSGFQRVWGWLSVACAGEPHRAHLAAGATWWPGRSHCVNR